VVLMIQEIHAVKPVLMISKNKIALDNAEKL